MPPVPPDAMRDLDPDGDVDLADNAINDLDRDGRIDGEDREIHDLDNDNDIDAADRELKLREEQQAQAEQSQNVGSVLGLARNADGKWRKPQPSQPSAGPRLP